MNTTANRRTFDQLRRYILSCLADANKTINQISSETSINWKTVELHLTFLVGRGLVNEIFRSEYVRIFELTDYGREHLLHVQTSGNIRYNLPMERLTPKKVMAQ